MAKVRQSLVGATASKPEIAPVVGGMLANSRPVKAILRAQDGVLLNGRRIVAAQSLCQAEWSFPLDANPLDASQIYHSDVERLTLLTRVHITPGSFLRLSVLAMPSGLTQRGPELVGETVLYVSDGAQGTFKVEVVWYDRDGDTETTTHELSIEGSQMTYGDLPSNAGAYWEAIRKGSINLIAPPELDSSPDELARWSKHVGARVSIYHTGGLRIVDAVLHEQPYAIALDTTEDASYWVTGLYGNGEPSAPGLDFTHPLQRTAESGPDPRAGTWTMLDVAEAQSNRLGPVLLSCSAWTEGTAELDGTSLPFHSTSSTSFVGMLDASQTSYDATRPGWSFSCGAYARRWAENHPLGVRGRDGSIPVRCRVYGYSSGGTGTVRVQTSPWSWVDVPITATGSPGWHTAYGHLRVGRGPGDDVVAQAFMRKAVFGTVYAQPPVVEYAGRYASAF